MLQPEEIARPTEVTEEIIRTTDGLQGLPQTTEAFERLSHVDGRRKFVNGRRPTALYRQQTDPLPQITTETGPIRSTWRQAVHQREENMRLRFELDEVRRELRQVMHAYTETQAEFEKEAAIIHNGYRQEIEQYQNHLREMMEERNRIQEAYRQYEQRYQELYHTFQDAVGEETRKIVSRAWQELEQPSGEVPEVVRDVVKALEARVRPPEHPHLIEALYFKNELKQMITQLDAERQQVEAEHQRLLAMQQTAREQAELRQKTLYQRFRARWRVAALSTSIGLLAVLVILQFVFLSLFHTPVVSPISFSLLAPIVICSALALAFSRPYKSLKHIYEGAPHAKKVQS
jgi:hypothetical protein